MRVLRIVAVGLLALGLVITSVGWYRSSQSAGHATFDGCTFDGDTLVLTWTNGVDSYVSPSVDTREGRIVVGLRDEMAGGTHIAIGLHGEARFTIFGHDRRVEYADGTVLECPPVSG